MSSTFKAGLLIALLCFTVFTQEQEKKTATSTISGKVTLKGNAAARIPVVARLTQARRVQQFTAETDTDGNYRIANVPTGTYEVAPAVKQYTLTGAQPIRSLIVGENENYDGVDFTLVPGGVITGRVTDGEGKPLIEQEISVTGPEGSPVHDVVARMSLTYTVTDDRGIYRVFGLSAGKYNVSAGSDEERAFLNDRTRVPVAYKRTFYPSTTDPANATLVEVTEGGEAKNVDIILRRRLVSYTVTGRVVDESGKPRGNVRYSLTQYVVNGSSSRSGILTDALGGFKFENLLPGKYAVALSRSVDSDAYAEPVPFEIVDQDVGGLVLKFTEGASITGSIVFEGVDEKAARTSFPGLSIVSYLENNRAFANSHPNPALMNADGSFRINGLGSGVVRFSIASDGESGQHYQLARVERGSEVVTDGLAIRDGEKISGVRIVIQIPTGGIRGAVRVVNGELQPNQVMAFVTRVGESAGRATHLDARGRFAFNGLATGIYDVTLMPFSTRPQRQLPKRQVIVTDGQVSEVTLTLDLKTEP
ncbi:MAG TPA: hypothetical protein VFS77_20945 [Pyrinomonadaceae bacterium]|nr:hypothetical protein [Pyrinomonadaceae bacterium]